MFVNILVLRVWVYSYGLSWKHKEKIITLVILRQRIADFLGNV